MDVCNSFLSSFGLFLGIWRWISELRAMLGSRIGRSCSYQWRALRIYHPTSPFNWLRDSKAGSQVLSPRSSSHKVNHVACNEGT